MKPADNFKILTHVFETDWLRYITFERRMKNQIRLRACLPGDGRADIIYSSQGQEAKRGMLFNDKTGILAISLGTAPAVITETFWALSRAVPPFEIDELHVVTTATGLRSLHPVIVDAGAGVWQPGEKLIALCDVLSVRIPELKVWLPSASGDVLDITSPSDCVAFGDTVCAMLCELTGRQDTAVHLSIAGGRKTMSYHAGAAMTLYGRAQDTISHILVSPPKLEQCRDFWWPDDEVGATATFTQYGAEEPVHVSAHRDDVNLTLVETPFYRARQWIPQRYLTAPPSFDRLVQLANAAPSDGKLVVDLTQRRVTINGFDIEGLSPAQIAMLGLFAQFAKTERGPIHIQDLGHDGIHRSAYMAFRKATNGTQIHARERSGDGIPRSTFSTLLKTLSKQLDSPEAVELLTPVTRQGLVSIAAPPRQIEVIGVPPTEDQSK